MAPRGLSALLGLCEETLDQRSFANARLTTDKNDLPLTCECLVQVCMEGSQFSITFEQDNCHIGSSAE
jgi:hypothetical protein